MRSHSAKFWVYPAPLTGPTGYETYADAEFHAKKSMRRADTGRAEIQNKDGLLAVVSVNHVGEIVVDMMAAGCRFA